MKLSEEEEVEESDQGHGGLMNRQEFIEAKGNTGRNGRPCGLFGPYW